MVGRSCGKTGVPGRQEARGHSRSLAFRFFHDRLEVSSQHASTVGSSSAKSSKSMTALNSAVRHATDGFIGILDMFGFEDAKVRPSDEGNTWKVNKESEETHWDDGCTFLFLFFFSRVSWNICALICAQKRCNTFIILTYSRAASNRVETREYTVMWKSIM